MSHVPHTIKLSKENIRNPQVKLFDKPLPSNVEVNNVINFIAYIVVRHRVLLASEDF